MRIATLPAVLAGVWCVALLGAHLSLAETASTDAPPVDVRRRLPSLPAFAAPGNPGATPAAPAPETTPEIAAQAAVRAPEPPAAPLTRASSALRESPRRTPIIPQPAAQRSLPTTCTNAPDAIGVSRTLEIDTTAGPRFGHQQPGAQDILGDHEIVLTFDDGPLRPYTQPILEALAYHCTKATFFMVGQMAMEDPAMAREVARRGHTIGTHTWSHANLQKGGLSGLARNKAEVELGFSAVKTALGRTPAPFFRFPYLADSKALLPYLQGRHVGVFSIDGDSSDYRTHDPAVMQRNVLNQLSFQHKGILLFHDIQPATAHGIRALLSELAKRGYKVVQLVPKSSFETLATYDTRATSEHEALKLMAEQAPIVSRTVTGRMPVPASTLLAREAPVAREAQGKAPQSASTLKASAGAALPKPDTRDPRPLAPMLGLTPGSTSPDVQASGAAPQAPSAKPPSPSTPRSALRGSEDAWQDRVFRR